MLNPSKLSYHEFYIGDAKVQNISDTKMIPLS